MPPPWLPQRWAARAEVPAYRWRTKGIQSELNEALLRANWRSRRRTGELLARHPGQGAGADLMPADASMVGR
jgi:hypothetical protein